MTDLRQNDVKRNNNIIITYTKILNVLGKKWDKKKLSKEVSKLKGIHSSIIEDESAYNHFKVKVIELINLAVSYNDYLKKHEASSERRRQIEVLNNNVNTIWNGTYSQSESADSYFYELVLDIQIIYNYINEVKDHYLGVIKGERDFDSFVEESIGTFGKIIKKIEDDYIDKYGNKLKEEKHCEEKFVYAKNHSDKKNEIHIDKSTFCHIYKNLFLIDGYNFFLKLYKKIDSMDSSDPNEYLNDVEDYLKAVFLFFRVCSERDFEKDVKLAWKIGTKKEKKEEEAKRKEEKRTNYRRSN